MTDRKEPTYNNKSGYLRALRDIEEIMRDTYDEHGDITWFDLQNLLIALKSGK